MLDKRSCLDSSKKDDGVNVYELNADLYHDSSIDWDAALEQLAVEDNKPFTVDGWWGIKNFHGAWKIDPIFISKQYAIIEYYIQYLGGEEYLPKLETTNNKLN